MKADVLLGLQWGDEGKGKIVDVLTPHYTAVARFQGGPNAGHTLEFDGKKFVLRSIPSGVFQNGTVNIIGNGVVLDPVLFSEEAKSLEKDGGVDLHACLRLSRKMHLILPTHRLLDAAGERAKGAGRIGTTGKGIGPTYTDKTGRNGLRLGDIEDNLTAKYTALKNRHIERLAQLGAPVDAEALAAAEKAWFEAIEYIRTFERIDSEYYVNDILQRGESILCEGAQGTLLDVDFGSYPFVTSSNTVCAGACTGLGISPRGIGEVFGIFKAYCTRVGSGPFPTELNDATGKEIRDRGHEYGAVTGRERRCGWLDLVALKYSVMLNGVTQLIMMKSDVLDTFDEIKVCTSYSINGTTTDHFPFEVNDADIVPQYIRFAGWKTDLTAVRSEDQLPATFKDYVAFIEDYVGVKVTILSVGPDRTQTIVRKGFETSK